MIIIHTESSTRNEKSSNHATNYEKVFDAPESILKRTKVFTLHHMNVHMCTSHSIFALNMFHIKIVFLTCIPARGSFEVDTPIINTDISTKKSVTMKQSLKNHKKVNHIPHPGYR